MWRRESRRGRTIVPNGKFRRLSFFLVKRHDEESKLVKRAVLFVHVFEDRRLFLPLNRILLKRDCTQVAEGFKVVNEDAQGQLHLLGNIPFRCPAVNVVLGAKGLYDDAELIIALQFETDLEATDTMHFAGRESLD